MGNSKPHSSLLILLWSLWCLALMGDLADRRASSLRGQLRQCPVLVVWVLTQVVLAEGVMKTLFLLYPPGRIRTRRQSSGSTTNVASTPSDSRGRSRAKVVSQSQRKQCALCFASLKLPLVAQPTAGQTSSSSETLCHHTARQAYKMERPKRALVSFPSDAYSMD